MMGCDAAETNVQVDLVSATARGFQCPEVANLLDHGKAALKKTLAAANKLVDSLQTSESIVAALRSSREPPVFTATSVVCTGGRQFKTSRGQMYADVWDVVHPGRRLLNQFYGSLREHPDASLSTEVIYLVSSRDLNAASAASAAEAFTKAFARLEDLAKTQQNS